jgi:VWFA-related protein
MFRLIAGSLVGAAAVWLSASPTSQERPQFRALTDLAQVDAVVTDRNDRPVIGLTREDFEIVERGRPQTIAEFRALSIPAARRGLPARTAAAPLDTFTNEPRSDGRAFVIDDLHIVLDAEKLHRMKQILTSFMESLSDADQLAVVYVSRSDLGQDFTNDLQAQIRALDRLKAGLGNKSIASEDYFHNSRAAYLVLENVCHVLADSAHSRRALIHVGEEELRTRQARKRRNEGQPPSRLPSRLPSTSGARAGGCGAATGDQ